ncbi:hypothetical protein ID866_4201 [Astraeus odoratus]|nr:hypothetical protein ID866_4201 [Astraeus odoratus]
MVRRYADIIEHRYARPALDAAIEHFKEKPITMTFIALFAALAALPIMSFVGVSVFAISSIVFVATACAVVACLVAESIIVSLGICTLFSLALVAIFLTTFVFSMYSMLRFILLVRARGGSGAMEWALETREHFLPARPEYESDGSAIVNDRPNSEHTNKVEDADIGDQ